MDEEEMCQICTRKGLLIECPQCLKLFHHRCVGLEPEDDVSEWICAKCSNNQFYQPGEVLQSVMHLKEFQDFDQTDDDIIDDLEIKPAKVGEQYQIQEFKYSESNWHKNCIRVWNKSRIKPQFIQQYIDNVRLLALEDRIRKFREDFALQVLHFHNYKPQKALEYVKYNPWCCSSLDMCVYKRLLKARLNK